MKLNCKPGDLAVIVRAQTLKQNIGAIVCVVEFLGGPENVWRVKTLHPMQRRDGKIVQTGGFGRVRDFSLRPIRDNDGEDETLQWIDVPSMGAA